MSQRDDAKNEPEIIETDFPIDSGQEQFEPLLLTVDGHPAKGLITNSVGWSPQIVLLFAQPHPQFGTEFMPKRYVSAPAGYLTYGMNQKPLRLKRL